MRLTVDQLAPFGEDAQLVHFIDTAFMGDDPNKVGVAVSGGGDSMALLHLAKCRADLAGTQVEAVTVDHGLRTEAAAEAAMVAAFCADRDIPHTILTWDGTQATGNIAAAGRDARYALMADWAKTRGVGGILLGHTEDDVAETFLMRLARKSGVDGLAMMETQFDRHGVRWSRPLWQQSRAALRDYLRRHDVPWVDDPTNDDESHDRPKARKVLAALAPLGITAEVLKSVALNMGSARGALEFYMFEAARAVVHQEAGDVILERRPRPPIPAEIERRLLAAALSYVGGKPFGPRWEAMVDLEAGLTAPGKHSLAGCIVTQEGTQVRITRELNAVKDAVSTLGAIWDGRWALDGPSDAKLTIRALGDAIKDVPDWRDVGLPRTSLMATPAVFDAGTLIAAPVAGLQNGYEARIVADFTSFLVSR